MPAAHTRVEKQAGSKKRKTQNTSWSWQAISVFEACIEVRDNPGSPLALASPRALVWRGVCASSSPQGGRAGRCCISLEICLEEVGRASPGCGGVLGIAGGGGGDTTSFAEVESARCTMEQGCSFSPAVFAAQTLGFSASASMKQKRS